MEGELKIVEVIWLDAWGDDAHIELDAGGNLISAKRHNVGYLIKGDDKVIIITQGIIDNLFQGKTFTDGVMLIPRGMIEDIRILNVISS